VHVVVYEDGSRVTHDQGAKTFAVRTAAGHEVIVEDDGDLVVPGDVRVAGDVLAEGDVRDGSATTSTMAAMRTRYNAHVHVPAGGTPSPGSRM
jgi:phage baseplate assembly protein gpV